MKPQPELYKGHMMIPVFDYLNGKSDWEVFPVDAEKGIRVPLKTVEEVKEEIDERISENTNQTA